MYDFLFLIKIMSRKIGRTDLLEGINLRVKVLQARFFLWSNPSLENRLLLNGLIKVFNDLSVEVDPFTHSFNIVKTKLFLDFTKKN